MEVQDTQHMGKPISYEEGMKLISAEWCSLGSAGNGHIHERVAGMPVEHIQSQLESTMTLRLDGDAVRSDSAVCKRKDIQAILRNSHGNFAMEIDLGGFPAFPRYAFMTRVGGEVYLMLSTGGKWRRIP